MAVPARLLRGASAPVERPGRGFEVVGVRPDARTRPTRKIWPLALTIAFSLAAIFAVLVEQVVLAQSAFELSEIRAELAEARSLHEELLLEAAILESPGRIETYARTKLGMIDPDPLTTQYVVADIRAHPGKKGGVRPTGIASQPEVTLPGEPVALEGRP